MFPRILGFIHEIAKFYSPQNARCDEKYYDADASDQIDEVMSKYTQPVIKFKRKIIEHNDRKVIDIPLELEEALHIKVGEEVEISMEGDRIISQIIQRKSAKRLSLSAPRLA